MNGSFGRRFFFAFMLIYSGGENTAVGVPQDEKTLGFLFLFLVGATVYFWFYDINIGLFLWSSFSEGGQNTLGITA